MDIDPEKRKPYPRFIGVLLAIFIPGIAHFLSGEKKAGLILFGALLLIPFAGLCLAAVPGIAGIYSGLALLFLITPCLTIYILATSFRPMQRLSVKGWLGVFGTLILFTVFKMLLPALLPVDTHKIPTAGMQPTLQGRYATADINPTSIIDQLLRGKTYTEFRANRSGKITDMNRINGQLVMTIGDTDHPLPNEILNTLRRKNTYQKNELIWNGTIQSGDRITTGKISYWFKPPQRGDIVTFSTDGIAHQAVRPDRIYAKRIVGLPGETISIRNGRLMVNGTPITEPAVFQTLKYTNAGLLSNAEQSITLGTDEFLTLGDNTAPNMSLDGRFYGPIERDSILAKVQTIYWPVNRIRVIE
ncbi:signal peptidase I [Pontiellaceae bacterium B12227]|nr:signal peptidase I [Pontiellaceae bacterium B12227]